MANPNFNCTLNAWVSGNTIYANFTYSRSGSYSYYDITLPTPTMTIAGETFYDNDFANRVHSGVTVGSITSSTFSKSVGNGTYGVTWNCGSGQRSDFAGSWSTSVVVNTGTGPSSIAIKFNSASWNSVNTTTTIGSWGTGYTGTPNLENVVVDGNATAANWETMGRQGRQHATEATSVTDSVTNANSVSYSGGFVIKGCSKYKIAGYASTSVGNVKMIDADNVRYTPPYELTSLSYTSQSATTNGDVAVVLSAVTNSANNTSGRTIGFQARSGIVGKNLFDKDEVLPMCYLDSTGAMNSTDLWVVTPLIPVDAGEQYTYSGLHNVGVSPYSAYYAADGTIVSTFKQATGSNTITIPAGASYVRFSILNGNGVFDKNTFQIEEGTSATAYEAYSLTGEHSGWVDLPTTCSVGQTATLTVTCSKEQYSKIEVRQFTIEDQTDEVQYSTVSSTMVQTISTIKLYGPVGDAATGSGTTFSINNTSDAGITVNSLKGNTTQTTYTGKNLQAGSQDFGGTWTNSGYWTTSAETYNGLVVKQNSASWQGLYRETQVESGKTYTFSVYAKAGSARSVNIYLGGGTSTQSPQNKSIQLTTEWQRYSVTFSVSVSGNLRARVENTQAYDSPTYVCGYQVEEGSSPTSYEPYVGGIVSPNPDYPQTVNTVTGEQNITISDGDNASQTYTVDLGSIELCKIGDYQDYIYKSGEDWYIHKETGKYTIIDTDVTLGADYTNVYFAAFPKQSDDLSSGTWPNTQTMYLSVATFRAYSQSWNRNIYIDKFVAAASGSAYWVGFPSGTSLATATTKITGGELYYALKNSTDTQITESHLIEQLNSLAGAYTYKGLTAFSVSGNLPGVLSVSAITDANTKSKRIMKLYGSVDGKSVEIVKLYGSVNGKTKRIF